MHLHGSMPCTQSNILTNLGGSDDKSNDQDDKMGQINA
jgi:hypothetical protein